jgi:hypothetical protein
MLRHKLLYKTGTDRDPVYVIYTVLYCIQYIIISFRCLKVRILAKSKRVHIDLYDRQRQSLVKKNRPLLASERALQGGQTVELNPQTNIWLFAPGGALQKISRNVTLTVTFASKNFRAPS